MKNEINKNLNMFGLSSQTLSFWKSDSKKQLITKILRKFPNKKIEEILQRKKLRSLDDVFIIFGFNEHSYNKLINKDLKRELLFELLQKINDEELKIAREFL